MEAFVMISDKSIVSDRYDAGNASSQVSMDFNNQSACKTAQMKMIPNPTSQSSDKFERVWTISQGGTIVTFTHTVWCLPKGD